jgi:hypothetical protein
VSDDINKRAARRDQVIGRAAEQDDEKLPSKLAAERAGVAPATWRAYVSRDQAPKPDGFFAGPRSPWWWASTVDAYLASRPGQGHGGGGWQPSRHKS